MINTRGCIVGLVREVLEAGADPIKYRDVHGIISLRINYSDLIKTTSTRDGELMHYTLNSSKESTLPVLLVIVLVIELQFTFLLSGSASLLRSS